MVENMTSLWKIKTTVNRSIPNHQCKIFSNLLYMYLTIVFQLRRKLASSMSWFITFTRMSRCVVKCCVGKHLSRCLGPITIICCPLDVHEHTYAAVLLCPLVSSFVLYLSAFLQFFSRPRIESFLYNEDMTNWRLSKAEFLILNTSLSPSKSCESFQVTSTQMMKNLVLFTFHAF